MKAFFRALIIGLGCSFTLCGVADIQVPTALKSNIPPPDLKAVSRVLQDQKSGWIIASKESDMRVEPASLSKLMTAYVVFDEIAKGNLKESDKVVISKRAWKTEGSRMFVKVNTEVEVAELLKGLIIQSGNDAAVALAEHIAGSEDGFAELMNQTAARLGLLATQYRNSTGLPHPEHYTSARDLSELTRALIKDFPEFYSLYSIKSYTYNDITQQNRNLLLWRDDSVDGVKTGHTSSAGYCLVGSGEKHGMRLIATVMGTESKAYRAEAVHALLKYGFAAYEGFLVYDSDKVVNTPQVFKGNVDSVNVVLAESLYVTVAKGSADKMKASVSLDEPLVAPISQHQSVGKLTLAFKGEPIGEFGLIAQTAITEASWFGRSLDSLRLLWH
jgi:serine-type D-Ala-D-Ala carboxypeptidase (penicillin-binding protein 5/6)